MLGAEALISSLDELLKAADWEVFLTMLPRLLSGQIDVEAIAA